MIERTCEDCGERATRKTADGVWLCEADYDHLLDQWAILFGDGYENDGDGAE